MPLLFQFRYALRSLAQSPGFALAAVLILSLGIALNTAMFSAVDSVILRPLPYRNPDQLVMVWERKHGSQRNNVVAPADLLDWKAASHSFQGFSGVANAEFNLVAGKRPPESVKAQLVQAEFFPLLGTQPILGRAFRPEDDVPGAPMTVVLSPRLWQTRFGSDPQAVGSSILLDRAPATVIGVAPAQFPGTGQSPELWAPLQLDTRRDWRVRAGRFLNVVARLRDGVSLEQAQQEMSAIAQRLEREHPVFNALWGVHLAPLHEQFTGSSRQALLILLGAVGAVLLIACVNVANLLLIRAAGKERELSIRLALGASGKRIVAQLFTEALLLSSVAGLLGVTLAWVGLDAIKAAVPQSIPRLNAARIDPKVLLFTLGVSLLTSVVFGLVPSLLASRVDILQGLRGGARGGESSASSRLRKSLVVLEVALSTVLLIGGGLLLRSFLRLQAVDPGFQARQVLTLTSILPDAQYKDPQRRVAYFHEGIERLRSLPGVESAGAISFLPFSGMAPATNFAVVGKPPAPVGQEAVTEVRIVESGYFDTMRIPLRAGRLFANRDFELKSPRKFLISESMAREMFANEDPIGKQLIVAMGDDTPGEIVGVVGNVKHYNLRDRAPWIVYYPHAQLPLGLMTFVVRAKGSEQAIAAEAVRAIQNLDPEQAITEVKPMEEWLSGSVSQLRFSAQLAGVFAIGALCLGVLGIYGVVSYAVVQQRRSIAVRMAVGASKSQVTAWAVSRGANLIAVGLALGLGAGSLLSPMLRSYLFDVAPVDAPTFFAVAAILGAAGLAASYLPARRAAAINPIESLRVE